MKKLLVVEDDAQVRLLIERTIAQVDDGIRLDWAGTIEEALAKISLKSYLGVLSDIYLPGPKTGLDLWEAVHSEHPELPFVIMSSMDLGEYLQAFETRQCPPFLAKPFRVNELAAAVRGHLLHGSSPSSAR
jgi:DNA-binding NtrC family response regulator